MDCSPKSSDCLRLSVLAALVIGLLFPFPTFAAATEIRVVKNETGQPIAFETTGLSEKRIASLVVRDLNDGTGLRMLSLHVKESDQQSDPLAIIGTYELQGTSLRFTPQFPLRPGLTYQVVARPDAVLVPSDSQVAANKYRTSEYTGKPTIFEVRIPEEKQGPATDVLHVFPSTNVLPENQLKFYLHFSAPMSRGEAYQHLDLLKQDGTSVNLPFLELGEELWDFSGTRLTLLIDPGRIKQGVKPREDLGPALVNGQEFTLVIHSNWRDARGYALSKGYRKSFRVGPPIAEAIDPAKWKITKPAAGLKEPLKVDFPRPLDHALLERTLTIKDPDQERIFGEITVSQEEKRWEFHPDHPWKPGKYQIIVDTVLEDLAGNRVGRPFEVDQVGPVVEKIHVESVSIPFEILP